MYITASCQADRKMLFLQTLSNANVMIAFPQYWIALSHGPCCTLGYAKQVVALKTNITSLLTLISAHFSDPATAQS